ncbi:hypothetical protein ACIA58_25705 [Kribbella sp. NPDC051586]|uniref:hypothetical protein n=1 Tax=Kribbella sp. NPDC051586 TaxID=3364118 RepID=UPI0037A92661
MDDQMGDTQSTGGVDDVRRRPVVLQAGRPGDDVPRRSRRYLAWAGTGLLGVVAAAGLVAGGTAVWSAFDPGTPGQSPAPLWFPPPEKITPQSERITPTPTVDDHGGDRTRTPKASSTTEQGDDKGGTRPTTGTSTTGKSTTGKSTTGRSTSGKSTTAESTSGKHGSDDSGKSGSDDGPGHN